MSAKATIGSVPQATRANQVWTYDFVFGQSVSGKSLKILTLISAIEADKLDLSQLGELTLESLIVY